MPIKHFSKIFFTGLLSLCSCPTHALWSEHTFKTFDDMFNEQEAFFAQQRKHMHDTFDRLMSFENKSSDAQPQVKITKTDAGIEFFLDLKKFELSEKDLTIDATEDSLKIAAQTKDVEASFIVQNKSKNILVAFALDQKKTSEPVETTKDSKNKKEKDAEKVSTENSIHQQSSEIFSSDKDLDFSKTDARIENNVLSLMIPFKQSEKISIKINAGSQKTKPSELK